MLSVAVAAAAAWGFGAVWYGFVGASWMRAHGLTEETLDRSNPVPYAGSFVAALLVAGLIRVLFERLGVATPLAGAAWGLAVGLFGAAPWVATNVLFTQKPIRLIWIDGAYPAFGCLLMGLVIGLF